MLYQWYYFDNEKKCGGCKIFRVSDYFLFTYIIQRKFEMLVIKTEEGKSWWDLYSERDGIKSDDLCI